MRALTNHPSKQQASPRKRLWVLFLPPLLLTAACGDDLSYPAVPRLQEATLPLRLVDWNDGKEPVGQVAAVTEHGDDVIVMSDRGVLFFNHGVFKDRDPSIVTWRGAARVPAIGAEGEWPVGVDGGGRLRWLRGRGALDDVTDRFALPGPVTDLAALGGGRVGFAISGALYVSEGPSLSRYDVPATGLAGGGGRAVLAAGDEVRVLDPAQGSGRRFALPGVVAAAVDATGKVVAATARALYREADGATLQRVHEEPEGGAEIRGLAAAGAGVWVAIGDGLALLRGDQLLRGPGDMGLGGARLIGSPTGDLWLLGGGVLRRAAEADGGDADQEQWKRDVLPIYTRSCSQCHRAGGLSVDLSTYSTWAERRALIGQRVIDRKPTPMPPAGAAPLTTEELAGLQAWIALGK